MSKLPILPLWTDAYIADTRHLTTAEHGAYLLLLMEAWRRPTCALPDDDGLLARMVGMTPAVWAAAKPTVMAFWKRDGRSKTWTQLRLKKEHDRAAKLSKSQSGNSAKRWEKAKKDDAMALPRQSHRNPPIPIHTIPNGMGGDTPPIDPGKALFDAGVALLTAAGLAQRQARAMIAKWQRDRGDAWTREAIASAAGKTDPVSWIEKRKALTSGSGSVEEEARAISAATAERYRRMDMPGPEDWRRAQDAKRLAEIGGERR